MIPQTSSEPRSNWIIPRSTATSPAPMLSTSETILHPYTFRVASSLRFVATIPRSADCRIFLVWKLRKHSYLFPPPPAFRPSCIFAHYFTQPSFSQGILFTAEIVREISRLAFLLRTMQWIINVAYPKALANNTRTLMVIITIKLGRDFYARENAIKMLKTTWKFFRPLLYNFDTLPLL